MNSELKKFEEKIALYEKEAGNNTDLIIRTGKNPILFSAPHTMMQDKGNNTYKLNEPFTKGIALYLSEKLDCFSIVKLKDNKVDSNSTEIDDYKLKMLDIIKENNIKILIDLHGSREDRDFDVEFGTLWNLTADFSTIKELEDAFVENNIKSIKANDPFLGGGITKFIYANTEIDIIQLEINRKYRDTNNINKMYDLVNALCAFFEMYLNK